MLAVSEVCPYFAYASNVCSYYIIILFPAASEREWTFTHTQLQIHATKSKSAMIIW